MHKCLRLSLSKSEGGQWETLPLVVLLTGWVVFSHIAYKPVFNPFPPCCRTIFSAGLSLFSVRTPESPGRSAQRSLTRGWELARLARRPQEPASRAARTRERVAGGAPADSGAWWSQIDVGKPSFCLAVRAARMRGLRAIDALERCRVATPCGALIQGLMSRCGQPNH